MVIALKSALRFANFEAKKVLQPNPEVLSYFMAKILQKRLRIVCNFFTGGKPNSKFVPNSPHQLGKRGLRAASR